MKNKFAFREVIKINPKGGILNISDINNLADLSPLFESGIREQQDLVGKTGIFVSMYHKDEDEKGCEQEGEWLYRVMVDVVNEDEVGRVGRLFNFRETDLESTGFVRPPPNPDIIFGCDISTYSYAHGYCLYGQHEGYFHGDRPFQPPAPDTFIRAIEKGVARLFGHLYPEDLRDLILEKDIERVKSCLNQNPDMEIGYTYLLIAMASSNSEIVETLIQAEHSRHSKKSSGFSTNILKARFVTAINNDDVEDVSKCLELVDNRAELWTTRTYLPDPVTYARGECHFDPIAACIARNAVKVLRLFLSLGIPLPHPTLYKRRLLNTITYPHIRAETLREALEWGIVDVTAVSESDESALTYAACHNMVDHLKLLLKYGAELEYRNKEKRSAIDWAIKAGQYEAFLYLSQQGAHWELKQLPAEMLAKYQAEMSAEEETIEPGLPGLEEINTADHFVFLSNDRIDRILRQRRRSSRMDPTQAPEESKELYPDKTTVTNRKCP